MNFPPAPDAAPHSLLYRIYSLYAPYIPVRNKQLFFAVLNDPSIPSANPSDSEDPNPNPQWIMNALSVIDALLDPYNPLPKDARKKRSVIRGACMDLLMKLQRERRQQSLP